MFRFARGSISVVAAIACVGGGSTIIVRAFATRNAIHRSSSYVQQRAAQMSSSAETNDDSSVVKRVLVPIGDGSEEIETACLTDTLTRFGAQVVVASVMPSKEKVCTMSRGIRVRKNLIYANHSQKKHRHKPSYFFVASGTVISLDLNHSLQTLIL
jgi:hypothetical protein